MTIQLKPPTESSAKTATLSLLRDDKSYKVEILSNSDNETDIFTIPGKFLLCIIIASFYNVITERESLGKELKVN